MKLHEWIRSHDGMDVDPSSGVVEASGYGYRNEVLEADREAFERGLENQQTTQRGRDDYER